jgi:hypothetical protein
VSDIDQMAKQFKSAAEMQAYTDAQFRTIVNQAKKIHELEEEVIHLRKILENGTDLIKDPSKKIEIYTDVSDEEAICRIELKKLKDVSIERELTLEEAKRTEIYTKLLISLTAPESKPKGEPVKRLDDTELMKLLTESPHDPTQAPH